MLRKMREKIIGAFSFVKTYSQHLPLAFGAIFSMPCAVMLLRGTGKNPDGPVVVLYVGRCVNLRYIARILLGDYEVIERVDSNLFGFRRHQRRLESSADMTVFDIGWPYHRRLRDRHRFLEVPDWVNMAVELEDEWDDVVRGFRHTARNNDLRLIRRNGYHAEASRDQAEIEHFYDHMYLPFVRGRYADDAVADPRRHVIRRARQGWLLKVLSGEELIVAGVVFPEDDVLYFLWMGFSGQCISEPPEGAVSALYYFGIRHAFDEGLSAVDFTGTRAFLNDGAFRFKRKWGPFVEDTFSPSSILLRPANGSERAAKLCESMPVLARDGGELDLRCVVRDRRVDVDTFQRLEKDFACPGIGSITIVDLGSDGYAPAVAANGATARYRYIRGRLDAFGDDYVRVPDDSGH